MVMLRYADELRDPADFFEDVPTEKPDKEMVDLAVELIERKSGEFKPEEFENHYHTALKELVDEKLKGHKIRAPQGRDAPAARSSTSWLPSREHRQGIGQTKSKAKRAHRSPPDGPSSKIGSK